MVQPNLSSEDKLLIYCSRLNMDEYTKCKIYKMLNKVLDWDYILDCSAMQGVSPLLYWNLSKISNGKIVPPEIMKSLKEKYYSNLARNMFLYDELNKVLTVFKKAGIDTIVLKGAFLAEEIYKNIGLRSMSDIDLLIKEEDLQKAKTRLVQLKYSTTIIFSTKLHEQFQTIWTEELSFMHQNKKIFIDIHWDIQPPQIPYKVDINQFWNNIKSVKIAGIETLTFAPEDLLQHLCLHLDKHITLSSASSAKPLRDYCDISEVTRHYKDVINWDYLLQSSKDYGIEEQIFQCLSIAKNYFGALVPDNILSTLEPIKSKIDFEEIFIRTIKGNSKSITQYGEINYLMSLEKIDGAWNKFRIIFGDVFPSKEFMMYRYHIKNKRRVYWYYLIRSGTAFQCGLVILGQLPQYLLRSAFSK